LSDYGIVFDFDGTICLSETVHMDAWVVVARQLGLPLPEGFVDDGVGVADTILANHLQGLWGEKLSAGEIFQLKATEFRSRDASVFPLVPGVIRFMQLVKAHGIPMALATSSSLADITPVFSRWSMEKYFSAVFTIESVVQPKPEPEVYLKASKALNLDPRQVFVFEDSIPGVCSARVAGCRVIGVGTTYLASDLGELHDYIDTFDDSLRIWQSISNSK